MMALAEGIRRANSTDSEKIVTAMRGMQMSSPFGPFTWRALDHQATLGAFVGTTAVHQGRGVMKNFRYVDGASVQPSEAEVRRMRPADAIR
jgi:branched-chain amino acid transport system substrate-binding protein